MRNFYKKAAITLAVIFLISTVGFIISFTAGVKSMANEFNSISESIEVSPKIINIDSASKTIVLSNPNYYADVVFEQSSSGAAYIDCYNNINSNSEMTVSYDGDKAVVGIKRSYGKIKLTKEEIEKSILREIGNYPDAVVYIPSDYTIEIPSDYIYRYNDVVGITFKNKAELEKQYNNYENDNKQEYDISDYTSEIDNYKEEVINEIEDYKNNVIEEIENYK